MGTNCDNSINDYYKAVASVLEYKGEFFHDLDKPIGMRQKLMDSSAANKLGWKAKTSLIDGISKTYEFYKRVYCV